MENFSSPCPSPRPRRATTSKLFPPPRRSVTLPIQQQRRVSSSGPPDPQVETLYSHSSTRIVAFTAPSKSTDVESDNGTLPWSSKLERTIAIGPMRVYRPPGSVAFLSCGTVIKPILPKSQCWCVDEDGSKFVLLIRHPQYWRIELSMKVSNAKVESEKFKDILLTILFFEKTVCPFARGFTIELPEPPKGPVIKKPWRPVSKPNIVSVVEILPSAELESADEFYSAPSGNSSLYGGDDSDGTDDTDATPKYSNLPRKLFCDERNDLDSIPSGRPQTAPQPTFMNPNPFAQTSRPKSPLGKYNTSMSSSSESFHTTHCWHSPLTPFPPSPPESSPVSPLALSHDENSTVPEHQDQNRTFDSFTFSPETPGSWASPHQTDSTELISPITKIPTLVYPSEDDANSISTVSEISTPPRAPKSRVPRPLSPEPKIRHRATTSSNSRRRTLSPLPSPATIFSPHRQRQRQLQVSPPTRRNSFQARQIPGMVIRKTCEILLSPPSHLINVMLNIAAKISAGEWRGGWLVWGEGDGDLAFEVEGEMVDDYGYDLKKKPSSSNLNSRASSRRSSIDRGRSINRIEIPGSWEVD